MRWCHLILIGMTAITGCGSGLNHVSSGGRDMILAIRWQRLVDDAGKTCDRCAGTQEELGKAMEALRRSLSPLGIGVTLEEKCLTPDECVNDIMESNRIWVADRPLEDWLGAEVGKTVCGMCCAQLGETVECRTTSIGGQTYETIPAQLIVKAGLQAASRMVLIPPPDACCGKSGSSDEHGGTCCP